MQVPQLEHLIEGQCHWITAKKFNHSPIVLPKVAQVAESVQAGDA